MKPPKKQKGHLMKLSLKLAPAMVLSIASAMSISNMASAQTEGSGPPTIIRHRPNRLESTAPTAGSTSPTSAIKYAGGALIPNPVMYLIWYGNWNQGNGSDTPAGQKIVQDFANSIGGSDYYNINQTYSTNGYKILGEVTFGGESSDSYSRGSRLKDSDILKIINTAITGAKLPYDPNGVYFVLTSSDVNETSGFCRLYCGWHTAGNSTVGHVRYSFVGNANRCLNGCAAQTTGPNGNAGVDGMISVIAHELEEAATDADPRSGWTDSGGAENADKCAWTFGNTYRTSNGAYANVNLGGRDYLIQRNLAHGVSGSAGIGDYCVMSYVNGTTSQ
jgi:hypothetical protein